MKKVAGLVKDPVANKAEISDLRAKLNDTYNELVELQLETLAKAIELAKKVDLDVYVNDSAKEKFVQTLKDAETLKPKTNSRKTKLTDRHRKE